MTDTTDRAAACKNEAWDAAPLACPYCGHQPETDDGETGGTVECMNNECGVRPSIFVDHEEDMNGLTGAILAWNRRTPAPQPASEAGAAGEADAIVAELARHGQVNDVHVHDPRLALEIPCNLIARAMAHQASSAIPGRAVTEDEVERVKRAIIDAQDADTCWTYDDLARAAVAETRGGDDAEVAHAVAQMAAHDRDEALVRAMEAEKQLSDLTAILSQVRSELDAMTRDRDEARRRLVELERAEEVRDAVCEERNILAKRVGELEAALNRVHELSKRSGWRTEGHQCPIRQHMQAIQDTLTAALEASKRDAEMLPAPPPRLPGG